MRMLITRFNDDENLYRSFEDPQYAADLADGKVWLTTLENCRQKEKPPQADPDEGMEFYRSGPVSVKNAGDPDFEIMARRLRIFVAPGCVNVNFEGASSTEQLADAYVLCTTKLWDSNRREGDFGAHCVEISDPLFFFKLVTSELAKTRPIELAAIGGIHYRTQFYTGLEDPPGPLGFVKRPDIYAHQQEVRLLWTVADNSELKPFLLDVPEAARLCRVLPIPERQKESPVRERPGQAAVLPGPRGGTSTE